MGRALSAQVHCTTRPCPPRAVQGLAAYGVAMTCINTRPGRGF